LHHLGRHLRAFAHGQQLERGLPLRRELPGALERTVATRTQVGSEQ